MGQRRSFPVSARGLEATARAPASRLKAATSHGRIETGPTDNWHIGRTGLGWADLMFRESEVIIQTMLALVAAGVPSLPVHDSIIVPASACTLASELLTTSFKEMTGLKPGIEINNQGIGDR